MPRFSRTRPLRGLSAAAALAAAVTIPQAALAAASFEILPFTPALFFPPGDRFLSISADGQTVVGQFRSEVPGSPAHAARWRSDTGIVSLFPAPTPNPTSNPYGAAYAISADGSTIVGEASGETGFPQATAWDYTTNLGTTIPGLLGAESVALDASADGSVVLGSDFSGAAALGSFVWDATNGARSITALSGASSPLVGQVISDDGTVVAGIIDGGFTSPNEAFRWSETEGAEPLGFLQEDGWSVANAISGDGTTIAGGARAPSEFPGQTTTEAFRWTAEGGMEGLGQVMYTPYWDDTGLAIQSRRTEAFAVSEDGAVIVGGAEAAWLHSEEYGGMISIRDLLIQLGVVGLEGWNLVEAVDVSADGRVITGWGYSTTLGVEDYAWRAVIPEPSTALLLGFGLAVMSGRITKGTLSAR